MKALGLPEKDIEEFYTEDENLDMDRFKNVGVVTNESVYDSHRLELFVEEIDRLRSSGKWQKQNLVKLFSDLIPNFEHKETGKYLDGKM